ncbi:MAG TPA: restriction endonuclease [Gemmataceae bacterium]|nr:restriction endonuclease [Gemmataceae bacterium]
MVFSYLKGKWQEWKAAKERAREEAEEAAIRAIWRFYYESKNMDDVSRMTGRQFEEFLARLFSRMGYTDIRLTPANDQGGDVLCVSPYGVPVVVQAKRWTGKVGNQAVQELLGAMRHYGRNNGVVVTNSTFTQAAVQLAGTGSEITLCDKRWLDEQIKRLFPPEIPEFDKDRFKGIVKELAEITRVASTERMHRRWPRGREDYSLTGMLMERGAILGRELTHAEIIETAKLYVKIAEAHAPEREYLGKRALEREVNHVGQSIVVPPILYVEIAVQGAWQSRPSKDPEAEWQEICTTPATVSIQSDWAYFFAIDNASDDAIAGLEKLRGLVALQCLRITGPQLTDNGLAHICGFAELKTLILGALKITDAAMVYLGGLTGLQTLNIIACEHITDAGLEHWSSLSELRSLNISYCARITDCGIARLQEALPNCVITKR